MTGEVTLGDVCAVACADLFRGDGAILASPMGPVPRLGARLAKLTHAPGLVLTDGLATIVDVWERPIGTMTYSRVFDTVWSGRRHVIMGASQIDGHGRQNLSCLGDHARPKVQLLGARGAPGNTACHVTSYWVPDHGPRVLVPAVDFISGIGPGDGAVEIRAVVTNLAVIDWRGGAARLVSVHPGVALATVLAATGFVLEVPAEVPVTRGPTPEEAAWLAQLDPGGKVRATVRAAA